MMTKQEVSALMASVGGVVREYVSKAITTATTNWLEELDHRIKEIPAGPKGDSGERGPAGESIRGEKGEPGLSIKGDKGDTGERGLTVIGPQGERGPTGESIRGETGEKGDPGLSIVGLKGEPGEHGEIGPAGPKGDSGERGLIGEKGLDGKDGRDGRDGIAGKDGRDGEHGRDALQIDILPAIDPAKSYPRGTFAQHDGGTLRARTNTIPGESVNFSEWDVVQRGVADVQYTRSEDLRLISMQCRLTGGVVQVKEFRWPVPLFKGIFTEGTEYEKADVLQYGGSLWIVRADKTTARPDEQHADWQMIVRRGRDGKAGLNGKDGERGADGPRGKDLTQMDGNGRKW